MLKKNESFWIGKTGFSPIFAIVRRRVYWLFWDCVWKKLQKRSSFKCPGHTGVAKTFLIVEMTPYKTKPFLLVLAVVVVRLIANADFRGRAICRWLSRETYLEFVTACRTEYKHRISVDSFHHDLEDDSVCQTEFYWKWPPVVVRTGWPYRCTEWWSSSV